MQLPLLSEINEMKMFYTEHDIKVHLENFEFNLKIHYACLE